jgi:RimJ/RimL family protein N-acetyltransferase
LTELKPITKSDLKVLVAWRNDPHINRWLSNHNKTIEEAEKRYASITSNPANRYDGIYVDDKLIGYCVVKSVDIRQRQGKIGIIIGESDYWGRGIAPTVIRQQLRYCFEDLKLHRVGATVVRGNERSSRLFESLGFTLEGTLRHAMMSNGELVDLLVYSMLEGEYQEK